jgi:hypothetical protein
MDQVFKLENTITRKEWAQQFSLCLVQQWVDFREAIVRGNVWQKIK